MSRRILSALCAALFFPAAAIAQVVSAPGVDSAARTSAGAAVPNNLLGAASGIPQLDATKLLLTSQIPFGTGTAPKQVADAQWVQSVMAGYVPTSKLAAKSGVATLDGNGFVPSTQVPFGGAATAVTGVPSNTASGKVADDGILAWLIVQEQNLAVAALKAADASSGIIHVLGLNGVAETIGRTLAQQAGDVWNVADHGADGTAANDTTAFVNGLAYATANPYTVIRFPKGTWPLTVSTSIPGFNIPSNTVVEGAANNGSILTWNDRNTNNWSLLTDAAPSGGGRNSNIVLRNIVVQGTWGPCAGCSWTPGGNNAIFLFLIDDVTVDHVTSRYSGAFGMTVRASTNVKMLDDSVYYSASDGINLNDDSGDFAREFNIQHTADDCFSAHSDPYDQGHVRRNIQIVGGYCFDTLSVDIASPVSLSMTGTIIDSFRTSAITLGGAVHSTDNEGQSAGQDATIDNVTMTNGINTKGASGDPANFDPNDPHDAPMDYIVIGASNPRAGNLAHIPGENATSPYQYVLNNSGTSSVPIAGWRTIRILNSTFARHFGSTNTTALPNWEALGQGDITSINGTWNPSLYDYDLVGPAIFVQNPNVLRNLDAEGNVFEGVSTALLIPADMTGHLGDWTFSRNRIFDVYSCIDIEGTATIDGTVEDNFCDADPYQSQNRTGSGGWYQDGQLTGWVVKAPGVTLRRNTLKNASNDTNVNTSDPTTGDLFEDNIDYANPVTIDSHGAGGGIGYVHSAGFKVIQIGTNPGDPSFEKVLNVPVPAAPAMPTTGFWKPGDFVRNSAPSSSNTALGWLRVTLSNNGQTYPYTAPTNNTAGTDWIAK